MEIDLEEATASLVVEDLDVEDYGDLINAIKDGPSKPATVSFDIEWAGLINRARVNTSNNAGFGSHDWGGRFALTGSTAEWSGSTEDFSFTSDPASTSASQFAIIGDERNGVFFRQGRDEEDEDEEDERD